MSEISPPRGPFQRYLLERFAIRLELAPKSVNSGAEFNSAPESSGFRSNSSNIANRTTEWPSKGLQEGSREGYFDHKWYFLIDDLV